MRLTILYFAGARDAAGTPREELELEALTLGDVLDALGRRHPVLAQRRASLRLACNEVFAPLDHPVAPGDVIAVIPPVAGG